MARFIFVFLFVFSLTGNAQQVQQELPEKTRILFLLDASASMLANWNDELRIEAAKRILADLVDSLKVNDKLELGLRVYGHRYFRENQNCNDTRLEVGFGPSNHNRIVQKLESIKPKGTTPIAYSLEQAAGDFPEDQSYRNIIVIITDGIESCDGDPCQVSRKLQARGIFLKPFVIGIGGLEKDFSKYFNCIGKYFNARDKNDFRDALNNAIETSLALTSSTVILTDSRGKSRYTDTNVTFINNFTSTPAFDFIHYLDIYGNPDTVQVDPVLTYDIEVNTIPPVRKRNVRIQPGEHNHISIATPQGSLKLSQNGSATYKNPVEAVVFDKRNNLIHKQLMNTTTNYLKGEYILEVLTLPRKRFNIKIEEEGFKSIDLPGPGILNINNNARGFGVLYEINPEGRQFFVTSLDTDSRTTTLVLQPGTYKIAFRTAKAKGSKYTSLQTVTIREGESESVYLLK